MGLNIEKIDDWKIPDKSDLDALRGNIWVPLSVKISQSDMDRLPLGSFFTKRNWLGGFEYKIRDGRMDKNHSIIEVRIRDTAELGRLLKFLASKKPGIEAFGISSIIPASEPLAPSLPFCIQTVWDAYPNFIGVEFCPVFWNRKKQNWRTVMNQLQVFYSLSTNEYFPNVSFDGNTAFYNEKSGVVHALLKQAVLYVLGVFEVSLESEIIKHLELFMEYYQVNPKGIGPIQDYPDDLEYETDWLVLRDCLEPKV